MLDAIKLVPLCDNPHQRIPRSLRLTSILSLHSNLPESFDVLVLAYLPPVKRLGQLYACCHAPCPRLETPVYDIRGVGVVTDVMRKGERDFQTRRAWSYSEWAWEWMRASSVCFKPAIGIFPRFDTECHEIFTSTDETRSTNLLDLKFL